jgi:hypothetical protein
MSTQTLRIAAEVEKALFNVYRACIFYNIPKDSKFMCSYIEQIKKLRLAEDPDEYVIGLAKALFPNESAYHQFTDNYKSWYGRYPEILNAIMEQYELYYEIANL